MALMGEDGVLFLLRWIHFLAGITWIGLLYYFNLVQVPFFAETEAPVRTGAIQKLVPRALWWFRWGAMVTFLAGWLYLLMRAHQLKGGFFAGSYGWAILLGGILGSVMWANVWFVIWPNQKIIIQNAIDTAAGRPANPAVGPAGAKAGLASRTNVAMSIPMLFFMGAASHLDAGAAAVGRRVLARGADHRPGRRGQCAEGHARQGRRKAARHGVGNALVRIHPGRGLLHLVRDHQGLS